MSVFALLACAVLLASAIIAWRERSASVSLLALGVLALTLGLMFPHVAI